MVENDPQRPVREVSEKICCPAQADGGIFLDKVEKAIRMLIAAPTTAPCEIITNAYHLNLGNVNEKARAGS